jgi:choline-sulfatase
LLARRNHVLRSSGPSRAWWLALSCLLLNISPPSSAGQTLPPVILISIDTLRPDHLGCYSSRRLRTPNIDAFAQGGSLFTQVSSQVPLTFPSHVSLITSTYPYSNGIRDNSQVLSPNTVTLATTLKARGYRTAAFVGGFVLDRRFGLDQGFDLYDSPFDLNHRDGIDPSDLKRFGEDVTNSAEQWLENNSDTPFLLFIHLYDLHTPYKLPATARQHSENGYNSELSYIDETLGKFSAFLRRKGIWERALIVFLSDHGESLGEHGESTHGYFIYQSTLRVPLIIHWPIGSGPLPSRINEPASLLDVAPTILEFLNIPIPSQFQGRSLLDLFDSEKRKDPREVYGESLYAHDHYGCVPLLSLRRGRYKYIEAPRPELYDIDQDPTEIKNIYNSHKTLALSLQDQLQSLSPGSGHSPAHKDSLSPEVAERLRALGYLAEANFAHSTPDSAADPKDRFSDYREVHRAITLAYSGHLQQATDVLEQVLDKTPNLMEARNVLGLFEQKLGQHEKAVKTFRRLLLVDPSNILAHYNLGISYFNLQRGEDAVTEFKTVLKLAEDSKYALEQITTPTKELLGTIWIQQKEYAQARVQFEQVLTTVPRDFAAHYNLGWTAGLEGKLDEAISHIQVAVQVEPGNAEAHNFLGTLYLQKGDLPRARDQLAEATRIAPGFARAHYNLGIVLARQNADDNAAVEFRKAIQTDPQLSVAREALNQLESQK